MLAALLTAKAQFDKGQADAALATAAYTGSNTAPTEAQLNALAGGSAVTANNLAAIQAAVAAANADGTPVTQAELQGIISTINTAAANIGAKAEANTAGTLTPADYANAGVTGVSAANVAAINSALNSGTPGDAASAVGVSGTEADSPAEIHAIVNSYNKILGEANGSSAEATPGVNPLASDYAAIGANIGLAATDADNLALLNDIVGASQTADVDAIADIENLARIANAIQTIAAGQGASVSPALSVADLTTIGLNATGVTNSNLPTLLAAIAAKADDGSATDSLAKLQALTDNLDKTAPSQPALALGAGVSDGATASEATAGTGVITVNAEAGSAVTVSFTDTAGHTVSKTIANATGSAQAITLSLTDLGTGASQLADGAITVTALAQDAAGNTSQSATTSFTLDTQSPSAPTAAPAGYVDNVGAVQSTASSLSQAATTDDTSPGIFVGTGFAEVPSLYIDGNKVAATWDSASGILTPNALLSAGTHTIRYTLTAPVEKLIACHCTDCQHASGTGASINAIVPASATPAAMPITTPCQGIT